MPTIDLRNIQIAELKDNAYGTPMTIGDAMSCNLQLRFAEGRLHAESSLAEFIKKCIGGSISIGSKYIPFVAQKVMYGHKDKVRSIGNKEVTGLLVSGNDVGSYVGVSFYAPDMIDNVEKYTCVFVHKAMFGAPSRNYQTMGENIVFQTPTTTGEFLAKTKEGKELMEAAICDSVEDAIAWCKAVFAKATAAASTGDESEPAAGGEG